jgi:hypothetical protein
VGGEITQTQKPATPPPRPHAQQCAPSPQRETPTPTPKHQRPPSHLNDKTTTPTLTEPCPPSELPLPAAVPVPALSFLCRGGAESTCAAVGPACPFTVAAVVGGVVAPASTGNSSAFGTRCCCFTGAGFCCCLAWKWLCGRGRPVWLALLSVDWEREEPVVVPLRCPSWGVCQIEDETKTGGMPYLLNRHSSKLLIDRAHAAPIPRSRSRPSLVSVRKRLERCVRHHMWESTVVSVNRPDISVGYTVGGGKTTYPFLHRFEGKNRQGGLRPGNDTRLAPPRRAWPASRWLGP